MGITKEILIENLFKIEKPINFEALEKFNSIQDKTCTSKDIIEKVQEMVYTGEWIELYNHVETEEVVNDLHELDLIEWPKSYVLYNVEKSDITIAEDTTRLNELLDQGYYTYCRYTDHGFEQTQEEDYYKYFVECAEKHIPHLYFESKEIAKRINKPIESVLLGILNNKQ